MENFWSAIVGKMVVFFSSAFVSKVLIMYGFTDISEISVLQLKKYTHMLFPMIAMLSPVKF